MARAAAVTLAITGPYRERSVSVSVREGRSLVHTFEAAIDEAYLEERKKQLRDELTQLHDVVGDALDLSPPAVEKALGLLSTLAGKNAYALFRGSGARAFFEAADLLAKRAADPALPPEIIEVSMPGDFAFPFELLPWHGTKDVDDVALRLRRLIGASAIVRRRIRHVEMGGSPGVLDNADGLAVNLFCHPKLAVSASDSQYLIDAGNVVDLYGPWPRGGSLAEGALVRHLVDSSVAVATDAPTRPAAVLHLACHTNTVSERSDEHMIDVGGPHGSALLGDLRVAATEASSEARPLVFLNSCGSGVPPLTSRVSFPEFFIGDVSVGVIGTLCDISNEVAGHFGARFYERLLRGATAGEALYDARWHLMDRHANPLGLLYTLHGNPDTRVSRPRAGEIVPACRPAPAGL